MHFLAIFAHSTVSQLCFSARSIACSISPLTSMALNQVTQKYLIQNFFSMYTVSILPYSP